MNANQVLASGFCPLALAMPRFEYFGADTRDLSLTIAARVIYGVENFSDGPLMTNHVTEGMARRMFPFYVWPRNGAEASRA